VRNETSAGGTITNLVLSGGTSVEEYDGTTRADGRSTIRGSDYGGGVGRHPLPPRVAHTELHPRKQRGDVVAKTTSTGSLTYQAQYEASATDPSPAARSTGRRAMKDTVHRPSSTKASATATSRPACSFPRSAVVDGRSLHVCRHELVDQLLIGRVTDHDAQWPGGSLDCK